MSRDRELYMDIEAEGRTFTFQNDILNLVSDDKPKILKAYFAKKKETYYAKISKAQLEDEVYIIVETKNLEGEKVNIKIHEREDQLRLLKNKEDALPVLVFDDIDDVETDSEANPSIEIDIIKESAQKIGRRDEEEIELGIKKIKLRPKQDTIENEEEGLIKSLEGWKKILKEQEEQKAFLRILAHCDLVEDIQEYPKNIPITITPTCTEQWMPGVPREGNFMRQFKGNLKRLALQEYRLWHSNPNPNPRTQQGPSRIGNPYWERDLDRRETLIGYWTSACTNNNTNRNGRYTDLSDPVAWTPISESSAETKIDAGETLSDTERQTRMTEDGITKGQEAWSAAFICHLIKMAGIDQNSIFPRSFRHVEFTAFAIMNKENNNRGNPFWGYGIDEYAPQEGDLVVRSRTASYRNVFGRANNHVPFRGAHTDVIVSVHSGSENPDENYIIVIGGNLELNQIQTDWNDEGRWINRISPRNAINVSVGKRKIYLDSNGKIDPNKDWEIFNNGSSEDPRQRVQFVGSQREYFAIIKIRENPCDT